MSFKRWFDKTFSLDLPLNHDCDYSGHIWGDWEYIGDKAYRECRWCGFRRFQK